MVSVPSQNFQNLRCGVAGWSYPHWNGVVFPQQKSRVSHPVEFLSKYFSAIEINTTFYRCLRPEVTRLWAKKASSNPDFKFTAKLHRGFTHERKLDGPAVAEWKEGLFPLLRANKLGCVLMQFPWTFRYTEENREFLILLRRTFSEFPLVVEMRHGSWTHEEALGTLIDYNLGFCNIDQPAYTKATPPTAFLTSAIGYVRLHGRNAADWGHEFEPTGRRAARHDYLYSLTELLEWKQRVDHIREHAASTFVIANNDSAGKAVVNALQLQELFGDSRRLAPVDLIRGYPLELADFHAERPMQRALFQENAPSRRVA